jgi:hypothetical protein
MNYENDIKIDETALDVEWLDQPSLMMKYARILAEARLELDRAKEAVDLIKAKLDKDIRTSPNDYGIGKITESVVENAIIAQPAYVVANQELMQAKYDNDIAYGAVKAIDARKDALENLVRLHGQQYFAGPKMPRDLKEEYAVRQKKQDASVASKISRTK